MKTLLLINAIVWASLILVAAYMFKDVPDYNYFFFGLVFCAGLMNSLIYRYGRAAKGNQCIR